MFLGIDVGYSVIKAALYDEEGEEVALSRERVKTLNPKPGFYEASMSDLWIKTRKVVGFLRAEELNWLIAHILKLMNLIGWYEYYIPGIHSSLFVSSFEECFSLKYEHFVFMSVLLQWRMPSDINGE